MKRRCLCCFSTRLELAQPGQLKCKDCGLVHLLATVVPALTEAEQAVYERRTA